MASEIKIHLGTYLNDSGIKSTTQRVGELARKVKTVNNEIKSGTSSSIGSLGKLDGAFGKIQGAIGGLGAKAMSVIAAFKVGWDIGTWLNDKVITPLFGIKDPIEELKKRNRELRKQAEEAAQAWSDAFDKMNDGVERNVSGIENAVRRIDAMTESYMRLQKAAEAVQKTDDDARTLGLQRDKFNAMAGLASDGNSIGAAQAGKYYDVLIAEEEQKQKLAKFDRDAEASAKRRSATQATLNKLLEEHYEYDQKSFDLRARRYQVENGGAPSAKAYDSMMARIDREEKANDDKLERLNVAIAKKRAELKAIDIENGTSQAARANLQEQTQLEIDAKKQAYDEYIAYVEKQESEAEATRVRDEQEAARKIVEAEAQERRKMEQQLAKQRIDDLRSELQERQRAESEASSRQAAANGGLSTAWGWYRNQASMQAVLDERKAQAEAEKQWEKDFSRLKSRRRDWRTAEFGTLSAAEESVRQVALAKEEKAAADRAVIETAENTRQLAEKLDELLQVKG